MTDIEKGVLKLKVLFVIPVEYILVTVHLNIILINNQLDAQFIYLFIYFDSPCAVRRTAHGEHTTIESHYHSKTTF